MKEVNFVKKIESVLKENGCLETCSIYCNEISKSYGSKEIDWIATRKVEEETGDEAAIVYTEPTIKVEKTLYKPLETGDIQLTYDGGFLWSVMNCEFGSYTYNKVIDAFDKICEKYGYSYEYYSNWAMVFYKEK